ncbi:hypothetical protein KUW15_03040 [Qipengyuania aquimaris]|uniref:hypothetical protein n=1 Tax=Qipengyuania aquimaris TaxID=255984 RepID=UPI001C94ACB9|nr:hypothetical protein [Qipengyuania aquimaris]MBY6127685.1 hypothetical protein [Qipengyuania aquimaris]
MRFQLFKCEISRVDRLATTFVVASDERRASEIVIENEIAINQENQGFVLERVDDVLPPDQRKGLDALLECCPAGLASYNAKLGWVAHAIPSPKLHFFRIQEAEGDEYFVIAPTADVAAAIYFELIEVHDDQVRLFRILDGFAGLKNDSMRGLPALLEFGPIGEVIWSNERGWSLA